MNEKNEGKYFLGKTEGTWDYGIIFKKAKEFYIEKLKEEAEKYDIYGNINHLKRYTYLAILLTQIVNGSRVSEAAEAIYRFYTTEERECYVRVRKHKKKDLRKMIIPNEIDRRDLLQHVLNIYNSKTGKVKTRLISDWTKKNLAHNTHSNRYAYITYLCLEKNISPTVVAKITKHKNLNYILHYVESKQAEKILEDIVLGDKNE